jgi:hypothetical protein
MHRSQTNVCPKTSVLTTPSRNSIHTSQNNGSLLSRFSDCSAVSAISDTSNAAKPVESNLLPVARITHRRPCMPQNHHKTSIITSEIQCVQRSQRRQPSPRSTVMDLISIHGENCSSHQRKWSASTCIPSGTSMHKTKSNRTKH